LAGVGSFFSGTLALNITGRMKATGTVGWYGTSITGDTLEVGVLSVGAGSGSVTLKKLIAGQVIGTFNTYTLKVSGREILIRDLTIENNAPQLGQAVALFADGDGQYYYNCRFLGNQDTVYTGPGKATQHFQDCIIEGTTDFIFGPATAYFDNCTIISKKNSYITAAATPKDVEVGYVFTNCYLKAAPGVTKCYLGRPWRPYAYTLFQDCWFGSHICPEGWDNWRNPENEKTARYIEARNYGPGADTSKRVPWVKTHK
jgi:pectin methylesterase-like acyl-CoA thioesterase